MPPRILDESVRQRLEASSMLSVSFGLQFLHSLAHFDSRSRWMEAAYRS
jgi:hypothetical protein